MWEQLNSFKIATQPWVERENKMQHHFFYSLMLHSHWDPFPLFPLTTSCCSHILPMIAPCNDPLKRDRQTTTVPRRATQSCEILSVWGLLAQITCPSDVFGPEWRMVYATQQTQQCVNERRIWFVGDESEGGWRRGEGVGVCVGVCSRGSICAEEASGGPLPRLVIAESCGIMKQ